MLKRRVATNVLSLCSRCLQPSKPAGQSLQYVRGSVTAAANFHNPDSRVIILTLPMLSPTMTQGSLSGWAKNPGDVVEPYDLVYELETETLTEEAYRMGDFAGEWTPSSTQASAYLPNSCMHVCTFLCYYCWCELSECSIGCLSHACLAAAVHDLPVLHRTCSHGD